METASARVMRLNGSLIQKLAEGWEGFFEGSLGVVKELQKDGHWLQVHVSFLTSPLDINGYIWLSEVAAGTTDKVKFVQPGAGIEQSVVRIDRIGLHDPVEIDRYELDFELDGAAIVGPVGFVFLWNDSTLARVDPVP